MNDKILRELNNKGKHILRDLHNVFDFDFEECIYTERITGAFTVNQVVKKVNAEYNDAIKCNIIVLLKDKYNNEYNVVTLPAYGDFDIEFRSRFAYYYGECNLDRYIRKGDFNAARKDSNAQGYIIAQLKRESEAKHENKIDYNARYIPMKSYSGRYKFARAGYNGVIAELCIKPSCDESEIIDKSGYIVINKRDNLKTAAKKLANERKKVAYIGTSHDKEIEAIKKQIENRKAAIMIGFAQAQNYSDTCDAVASVSSVWRGFLRALKLFETLVQMEAEKGYNSNDEFTRRAAEITAELAR